MDSRSAATKHCNRCGRDLPVNAFYAGSGRDKYLTPCKECRAEQYRERTPDVERRVLRPIGFEKTCPKCGQTKPLDQFAPKKDSRDGRSAHCRACRNEAKRRYDEAHKEERSEYNRRYYREHPEECGQRIRVSIAKDPDKYRQIHSAWKRRNPDKQRSYAHTRYAREKSGGSWTAEDWQRLKAQFDWRCLMCGRQEMTDGIALCFDHVIPLDLGGWNIISNAQPLCKSCNSKKHRKVLDLRRHKE